MISVMKMEEKTNAMRYLDSKKIKYESFFYGDGVAISGPEVARELGADSKYVYKTLVTVGKSGNNYVFVVPVDYELDLKKAAKAVGEKNVEMIKSKELLPLTGYIHGGCSPIGMKKFFKTTVDSSAEHLEQMYFSGGRIGCQLKMTPSDLAKAIRIQFAEITKD